MRKERKIEKLKRRTKALALITKLELITLEFRGTYAHLLDLKVSIVTKFLQEYDKTIDDNMENFFSEEDE